MKLIKHLALFSALIISSNIHAGKKTSTQRDSANPAPIEAAANDSATLPTSILPMQPEQSIDTTKPTTSEVDPLTSIMGPLSALDGWDLAALPQEQQQSMLSSLVAQLRRTAHNSAETLNAIALALSLQTNLNHLGGASNAESLATNIAALNTKRTGEGTTIAFNACREAMKSNNKNAFKSLLRAIKMLGIQQEFGATDRANIDAYAREIAEGEINDLEESITAAAENIRELAEMSRMVHPSGRDTPPALDITIEECTQASAKRILDTASAQRFKRRNNPK